MRGDNVMKKFNLKKLTVAVTTAAMTVLSVSTAVQASDIEIYQAAKQGSTTLMFMIDVSGSMTSEHTNSVVAAGACDLPKIVTDEIPRIANQLGNLLTDNVFPRLSISRKSIPITVSGVTYNKNQCRYNNQDYDDRMSKVKEAMLDVLAGNNSKNIKPIADNVVIGFSTLGANNGLNVRAGAEAYNHGTILVPARPLSEVINGKTQRQILIETIAKLEASSATPTARSFAETVAYMMGTTSVPTQTYRVNNVKGWVSTQRARNGNYYYLDCLANNDAGECSTWGSAVRSDKSNLNYLTQGTTRGVTWTIGGIHGYRYVNATPTEVFTPNGFSKSVESSKTVTKDKYLAPRSLTNQIERLKNEQIDDRECSGQGVYVLTDGVPTNDAHSKYLMRSAINDSSFTCADETGSTFECTEKLSTIILDKDNPSNPSKVSIKTAVVGFGGDFADSQLTKWNPPVKPQQATATQLADYKAKYEKYRTDYINDLTRQIGVMPVGTQAEQERKMVFQAAKWGAVGRGGWYSGNSSQDVVDSIESFLNSLESEIPDMTTGTPVVPQDPLNRLNIRPEAYYGSLSPKPHTPQRIWAGNMNKYKVVDGVFKGDNNVNAFDEKGVLNASATSMWVGGSLNKLPLGIKADDKSTQRKVFTDRKDNTNINSLNQVTIDNLFSGTYANDKERVAWFNLLGYNVTAVPKAKSDLPAVVNLRQLGSVLHSTPVMLTQEGVAETQADLNLQVQFGSYETDEDKKKVDELLAQKMLTEADVKKIQQDLAKVIEVKDDTTGKMKLVNKDTNTELGDDDPLRELVDEYGLYIYDDQKAKVDARLDELAKTPKYSQTEVDDIVRRLSQFAKRVDRKDYMMYGSTQGVLHIVDAKTGVEKIAFVPNEMLEKQANAFRPFETVNASKNADIYYGVDAPWIAYTQYIEKPNTPGVFTVNDPNFRPDSDQDFNDNGLQWVYGGLRMGGRSYYALDLSNIDDPKLKFSILPDKAAAGTPLSYMGQSWSKPTLGYVNWQGKTKLVMIVGGGYDPEYEKSNYSPTGGTITKGAGVYMFDAHKGDLLWWSSANATTQNARNGKDAGFKHADLKYSVVSQINASDLNNDGLIDSLYFGDLGGQAFRVDINNEEATQFAKVTRIFADRSEKVVPRFYDMPSVSLHSGDDGLFVAVSFTSGDSSSPLAGRDIKGNTTTETAQDATYVFYDVDVLKNNLFASDFKSDNASAGTAFEPLNLTIGTPLKTDDGKYRAGWKYTYPSVNAGQLKGFGRTFAISNILFATVYDRDGEGLGGQCGAGVRGNTRLYNFCLPFGLCTEEVHGFSSVNLTVPSFNTIGPGRNGPTLFGDGPARLGVTTPTKEDPEKCKTDPSACDSKCVTDPQSCTYDRTAHFTKLHWYESR